MAEYIMKNLVSKAGLSERFEISSAATSAWAVSYTHLKISAEEAYEMMISQEIVVVDVRTREEYDGGHIENAVLVPCLLYTSRKNADPINEYRRGLFPFWGDVLGGFFSLYSSGPVL